MNKTGKTGYQINLRSLDSEKPVVGILGVVEGADNVPISDGDAFVVVTLKGETISIVTTGLNAEGISNLLKRLHIAVPQIVEKLTPAPVKKSIPLPLSDVKPATGEVVTGKPIVKRIEIPTDALVSMLKQRGLDVGDIENQLNGKDHNA